MVLLSPHPAEMDQPLSGQCSHRPIDLNPDLGLLDVILRKVGDSAVIKFQENPSTGCRSASIGTAFLQPVEETVYDSLLNRALHILPPYDGDQRTERW
ncbi:hypothetical protein SDC9_153079 [bioreactor metagenome]|uniref:Uncharacterized protein n=1 Tax=bioreactor metagenome TaxID=1076179 RepID=A0A645EUY1_9ZZZZ